ncbi:MAG: ABC transporter ATP-binding protein [Rhodospirillaceae bacterium]|jgi:branched-chain amino acid transport system ATP-binding protein|nr:ABC transporter ATP-binding protein [Rhodospirillaceae bacterium]MBT3767138.1 ABC transporter ATP-binding protein [Rhodospirillales bacterium]MBT5297795.1 ABC transporter ATP-binding protein [Rhodospirillaceae bacterium]MBT6086872.1 ABC transporter ATP-binding protein [Rhodospirillaceae bacterium]MBT6885069.1 ABC transporter ATP-binding protein [Rhodospirillaceae bacterium]
MTSHLRCDEVTVRFGGVVACNKISLDVEEGKIIGLIGPNGAGKTTLFNVLSRFQDCDDGHVYYRDQQIDAKNTHDMINLGMARTFQNINLFGEQTTLENILIGAHHLIGNPYSNMLWLPSARRNERELTDRAVEIAEMLNLGDELDNPVKNLPYGHQKRVEMARALAAKPEMILLDEPVAGCNDEETAELKEIVKRINSELGITIFLVEHDMAMVMTVCDYIYVINFGANLAQGTPSEIQSNRDVIKAYLGEDDE